jgi:hypothetical protein
LQIEGDLDVYKFEVTESGNDAKIDSSHDWILTPGRGYYLRAKLFDIWKMMNIVFFEYDDQQKLYLPRIGFEADTRYGDDSIYAVQYMKDLGQKVSDYFVLIFPSHSVFL